VVERLGDSLPEFGRTVASGLNRSEATVRKEMKKEGEADAGGGGGGYSKGNVQEGVGLGGQGRDRRLAGRRASPGLLDGGRRRPDRWGPPVSGRKRG
jgi:hypothetical protein